MVKRPKIKEKSETVGMKALCFLHYRYAHSENTVFTEKELSEQLVGVSKRILHYSFEDLRSEQWIDREPVDEDGVGVDGYSISRRGIDLVESWDEKLYQEVAEGIDFLDGEPSGEPDSWKNPDAVGELSPEATEQIKSLIDQAIDELPNAKLSNEDQSQAMARLESAKTLANAPTPPWRMVKELLEPMSQMAGIGSLIIAIIALIIVI